VKESNLKIMMSNNLSPINRSMSPGSSNEDQDHVTPPPLTMPPEIRIFQQENGNDKGYQHINNTSNSNKNNNSDHILHTVGDILQQTPTLNSKKSFCIDALLAKNKGEENEPSVNRQGHYQYVNNNNNNNSNNNNNNNYKDNVISRDLNNSSPEDNLSRLTES
jgi:hypothetical protein